MPTAPTLDLLRGQTAVPHRAAAVDAGGVLSYAGLLDASARLASALLAGAGDLGEARVACLVPPGRGYAVAQWGVWRAGGVFVPLCLSHPRPELEHVLRDSGASVLIAAPAFAAPAGDLAAELGLRQVGMAAARCGEVGRLPVVAAGRRAMLIYTSGTTGKPKGVVWPHGMVAAQADAMIRAWGWCGDDRILNVLPLHHVHGIVNVLDTALACGATWETQARFNAAAVWRRFAAGGITLFMAVPTVYARLIAAWEAAPAAEQRQWSAAAARLRLMVSGSAALPVEVLERWHQLTGHVLLERYGMSEIGMALSNPLAGERRPGHVGTPMPGVEVRLLDDDGGEVPAGSPGEIFVRGPGVFREYWQRPEDTAAAFRDGFFATGDVAVLAGGSYRILGRRSVDILKSGGYKLSALEIEAELRRHPAIADCAVVGIPDPHWGERVAVAAVLRPNAKLDLETLRTWARDRLAPYKLPTALLLLPDLPRNALGKVVKPEVKRLFEGVR